MERTMSIQIFTPTNNLNAIPVSPENPIAEMPNLKSCMLEVHQRPNLREEDFQTYMGKQTLQELFDPEIPKINTKLTELYLHYPERWLNIVEQRSLFARIGKYLPKLEQLYIVTHSVYFVQCMRSDYIRIVTPVGFNGVLPQENVNGKLYI
jgi:hypothetical protein